MPLILQRLGRLPVVLLAAFFCLSPGQAAGLDTVYRSEIRPLLDQFCFECHADEEAEADINLDSFQSVADIRRNTKVWLKVDDMLSSRQMPPKKADKPSDDQRAKLQQWVHSLLLEEARARAGDPGRVVLRRLNNDEYNYSVRDLTGVASLNPTREFPIDGAAGEGFTNAGDAMVMSPALVGKFLDAGKEVAQHVVLLPDGIRFSEYATERDRADGLMAQIQNFYAQYVAVRSNAGDNWDDSAEAKANVINRNGSIPLEPYFAATLAERDALAKGGESVAAVARARGLNAKYLGSLWTMLTRADAPSGSFLLNNIRARWRAAADDNPKPIVDAVQRWQQALWRFDPIGHIGRQGGPTAWMNPKSITQSSVDFSLELQPPADGSDVVVTSLPAMPATEARTTLFAGAIPGWSAAARRISRCATCLAWPGAWPSCVARRWPIQPSSSPLPRRPPAMSRTSTPWPNGTGWMLRCWRPGSITSRLAPAAR